MWKIKFYVDEFEQPTKNAYLSNSNFLVGTFSNTATTDSLLNATVNITDDGKVYFRLWEYGDNLVNSWHESTYKVLFLTDKGKKYSGTGRRNGYGDRIWIQEVGVIDLLKNNSQIKIYLKENEFSSSYLFTVNKDNFETVYNEFYNKINFN